MTRRSNKTARTGKEVDAGQRKVGVGLTHRVEVDPALPAWVHHSAAVFHNQKLNLDRTLSRKATRADGRLRLPIVSV